MNLCNVIGGEKRAPVSGQYIDNINPATNRVISMIPRSTEADVDAAVEAARTAFEGEWSSFSANKRADLLDAVADRIEQRMEEFALAESRDNGKPLRLARIVDIPRAVANFRFFAGAIRHDETGCQP